MSDNKKKILLVNPDVYSLVSRYTSLSPALNLNDFYPLGLLTLASYMERNGYEARVLDVSALRLNDNQAIAAIKEYAPDIVGLTHSVYCSFPPLLNIARFCKQINPGIITVAGGIMPSYMAGEIVANCEAIDFVIQGEGERPLLRLIQSLSSGDAFNDIAGLVYKGKNGPLPPPGENDSRAADFPMPPALIKKLFIASKRLPYFRRGLSVPIEASRGCRYSCKFCVVSDISGNAVRYKEPKALVDELEGYLAEFGIRIFRFVDSTFTADRGFIYKIMDEITSRDLQKKIIWGCSTRVDCVDRQLLKDMKRSGCFGIAFGVETYSRLDMDYYEKRITPDMIKEAFSLAKEFNIKTMALFMLNQYRYRDLKGLRGELNRLVVFTKAIKADLFACAPFVIYPGTSIYKDCLEKRVINNESWRSLFNGHLVSSSFLPENRLFSLMNRAKLSFLAGRLLDRLKLTGAS
ncbi:MAG: radical SAM protein [Clostridia bacterium]